MYIVGVCVVGMSDGGGGGGGTMYGNMHYMYDCVMCFSIAHCVLNGDCCKTR